MKMVILIVGAAFTLVGCNQQQGGTSDQYGTERGISSTMTNAPGSGLTTITNTFGTQSPSDTNSQGGATSQGRTGTGTSSSETKTNSPSNP